MEENESKLDSFWLWVERALSEKGMSFRQAERQAGVANATISKRARLRMAPTRTTYEVLSKVLGASIRDMMVRTGQIKEVDDLITDSDFYRIMAALQHMTPKEVTNIARYIEFQFPDVYKTLEAVCPDEQGRQQTSNEPDTDFEA